jgi:hypothetical protein
MTMTKKLPATIAAVLALSGCATILAPPCDPADVQCRLDRIEARQQQNERRRRLGEFMRDSANQARRTCEFAHGSGSILCP